VLVDVPGESHPSDKDGGATPEQIQKLIYDEIHRLHMALVVEIGGPSGITTKLYDDIVKRVKSADRVIAVANFRDVYGMTDTGEDEVYKSWKQKLGIDRDSVFLTVAADKSPSIKEDELKRINHKYPGRDGKGISQLLNRIHHTFNVEGHRILVERAREQKINVSGHVTGAISSFGTGFGVVRIVALLAAPVTPPVVFLGVATMVGGYLVGNEAGKKIFSKISDWFPLPQAKVKKD